MIPYGVASYYVIHIMWCDRLLKKGGSIQSMCGWLQDGTNKDGGEMMKPTSSA